MNATEIREALQSAAIQPFDGHSVETLAHALAEAKDIVDAAREYVAAIEAVLVKQLPKGLVEVAGLGTLERKAGAKRSRWDHTRLAPLVALRAVEAREPDPATGEIPDPVTTAVDAVLSAAGISYWRTSVLRAMELDPEAYSDTEWGRPQVILRRNDEAAAA